MRSSPYLELVAEAVSTAAVAGVSEPAQIQAPQRPNLVSVGTIVWLSSELMFFAALFASYFTIRALGWGTGWSTGNIVRLNTVGATMPDTSTLLDLRRARLRGLVAEHRHALDFDGDGRIDARELCCSLNLLCSAPLRTRGGV